jgi:hypothetical protein
MSTHVRVWRTTELWHSGYFAAAAASWNGRAVAIRRTDASNDPGITTAVQMRVLRPG